jgi:DNA-binding CsgD family transcriptional regulator/PAS domain-containing protein
MRRETLALHLAEGVYRAAVDPSLWEAVLRELSEALGGAAVQLSLRIQDAEAELRARLANEPGPVFRVHLEEKYQEVFQQRLLQEFPWASIDLRPVAERFVRTSEMLDLDLEGSAFYREFMRPQGLALEAPLCHVIAILEARPLAGMVIYRREGGRPFAPADFALLDLLVPHLAGAYRIHGRLGDARHEQRALREVLDRFPSGVILLDKDSRIVFTNRSADQILAQQDGIRVDRGRPRLDSGQDREFQRLLAEVAQTRAQRGHAHGRTLSIVRPSGRRSYASMLGPLLAPPPGTNLREAAAILFVSDPEGSQISASEVLEGLYDLTPAEADLVRLLAEGRSLEEVAAQRGVTMNTARSQLKQVFAKTETRRQGELVRLVLTGVASLGDDGGH